MGQLTYFLLPAQQSQESRRWLAGARGVCLSGSSSTKATQSPRATPSGVSNHLLVGFGTKITASQVKWGIQEGSLKSTVMKHQLLTEGV